MLTHVVLVGLDGRPHRVDRTSPQFDPSEEARSEVLEAPELRPATDGDDAPEDAHDDSVHHVVVRCDDEPPEHPRQVFDEPIEMERRPLPVSPMQLPPARSLPARVSQELVHGPAVGVRRSQSPIEHGVDPVPFHPKTEVTVIVVHRREVRIVHPDVEPGLPAE
jgi:hypothetical protein